MDHFYLAVKSLRWNPYLCYPSEQKRPVHDTELDLDTDFAIDSSRAQHLAKVLQTYANISVTEPSRDSISQHIDLSRSDFLFDGQFCNPRKVFAVDHRGTKHFYAKTIENNKERYKRFIGAAHGIEGLRVSIRKKLDLYTLDFKQLRLIVTSHYFQFFDWNTFVLIAIAAFAAGLRLSKALIDQGWYNLASNTILKGAKNSIAENRS